MADGCNGCVRPATKYTVILYLFANLPCSFSMWYGDIGSDDSPRHSLQEYVVVFGQSWFEQKAYESRFVLLDICTPLFWDTVAISRDLVSRESVFPIATQYTTLSYISVSMTLPAGVNRLHTWLQSREPSCFYCFLMVLMVMVHVQAAEAPIRKTPVLQSKWVPYRNCAYCAAHADVLVQ